MMDLSTTYLGMKLRTPLVPSASPLSAEIDDIRRMEEAGASAVVLYSLFEEQIRQDRFELHHHTTHATESFPEALSFFPEPEEYRLGPEAYLEHIRKAKEAVSIPVVASLNGSTPGGWTAYARGMEEAGADAIELNLYNIPTDPDLSAADLEARYEEVVRLVREAVSIPLAVKVAPYFTNLANMAKKLQHAGADALVLFNRFYQPDIDLDSLEVETNVLLSSAQTFRLPLRWIAILHGRVPLDFAATGGIYGGTGAIKMLMVGANVTMLCSVLLKEGIGAIERIEREMREWMEEKEYVSVEQMRGSMSLQHSPDPRAFERAHYIEAVSGGAWHGLG